MDELAGRLQEDISKMKEAVVHRDAEIRKMEAQVKDARSRLTIADASDDTCEATCESKCSARCGAEKGAKKGLFSREKGCDESSACQDALDTCGCPDGWKPLRSLPTNCADTKCEASECCKAGASKKARASKKWKGDGLVDLSSSDSDK